MQMQPPAAPLVRFTVYLEFLDGSTQEVAAQGPIQVQPGVILISTPSQGHVGVNIAALKRWEVQSGGIAIALGLQ